MSGGVGLLAACALMMVGGSLGSLFSESHAFNRRWPPLARLHCAGYGLLNVVVGAICVALLLLGPADVIAVLTAAVVMLVFDAAMVASAAIAGLPAVGDGERRIGRWPVSYLSTVAHAGLVLVGASLCSIA